MELTANQIEYLFAFTRKKMVHFYDLQIEIVDHLAERIKEGMAGNADLTFNQALDKVYAGFGIFGFAHIVKDKQEAMHKLGNKRFYRAFKDQFTWPRAVRTFFFIGIVYLLAILLTAYWFSIAISIGLGAGALIILIIDINTLKLKKKLIFLQNPLGWVSYFLLQLDIQLLIRLWDEPGTLTHVQYPWLYTLIIVPGILSLFAYHEINIKLKKQAQELYPEAFA